MRPLRLAVLIVLVLAPGLRAQTPFLEAWDLLGNRQPAQALVMARTALLSAPRDPRWNLLAGRALVALNRFDESLPYLRRATVANGVPPYYAAWGQYDMALALYARGEYSRSARLLADAAALNGSRQATAAALERLHMFGLDTTYAGWPLVETPHLRLRFSPGAPVTDREAFARERENAFARNSAFFGGAPPKKIDLIVWPNDDAEAAGLRRLTDWPAMSVIHVGQVRAVDLEIARVVIFHAIHPDTTTDLISNGLLSLADSDGAYWSRLARDVVRSSNPPRLDLMQIWSAGTRSRLTYPVSGAFARFLLERGGRERLLQLARRQTPGDARRIYGPDLDGLVADFERQVNAP